MTDLRAAAEWDGISMNGFIVQAVAEQVAALRARGLLGEMTPEAQATYLQERASRAQQGRLAALLGLAGTTEAVLPGDEVPDGWLAREPGNDTEAGPASVSAQPATAREWEDTGRSGGQ